jgi:hypothetical protein
LFSAFCILFSNNKQKNIGLLKKQAGSFVNQPAFSIPAFTA